MQPRPDREGYLDYKAKVENGNFPLEQRAELECEKYPDAPSTALACYYNLHHVEKDIVRNLQTDAHQVIKETAPRLQHIRHEAARQEVSGKIGKLAQSWYAAKSAAHQAHIQSRDSSLKNGIAKRQAEHPGESAGEAWYWAKLDIETRHRDALKQHDRKLHEGIDNWIEGARAAEAKSLAAQVVARSQGRGHSNDNDREP